MGIGSETSESATKMKRKLAVMVTWAKGPEKLELGDRVASGFKLQASRVALAVRNPLVHPNNRRSALRRSNRNWTPHSVCIDIPSRKPVHGTAQIGSD